MDEHGAKAVEEIVSGYRAQAEEAAEDVWRRKLGLAVWSPDAAHLWGQLEPLLETTGADYTIFWRTLADLRLVLGSPKGANGGAVEAHLPKTHLLETTVAAGVFYEPLSKGGAAEWADWLARWAALSRREGHDGAAVAASMKLVSPKYVPREWMLAECYNRAADGDYAELFALHELFKRPYDEQPEKEAAYFRKTPPSLIGMGGIYKCTCSS